MTDDKGDSDTKERTITVVSPPANMPPDAAFDFSPAAPEAGDDVRFTSSSTDDDGTVISHEWDFDDDDDFDDGTGSQVTRVFTIPGTYAVSLEVTDDDGATDVAERTVTISAAPQQQQGQQQLGSTTPQATCGGLAATVVGTTAGDRLLGTSGDDVIAALDGDDRVRGLGGDDRICGGRGADALGGGRGADRIEGNKSDDRVRGNGGDDVLGGGLGDDSVFGGRGTDDCDGGRGEDRLRGCP